jgi:hypothetical protein
MDAGSPFIFDVATEISFAHIGGSGAARAVAAQAMHASTAMAVLSGPRIRPGGKAMGVRGSCRRMAATPQVAEFRAAGDGRMLRPFGPEINAGFYFDRWVPDWTGFDPFDGT